MSQLIGVFVIFVTLILGHSPLSAEVNSIQVITRDGFPIAGPASRYGATFEKREEIPIEIQQRPFQALYNEIMFGFVTGKVSADVLLIPSAWLPDFAPYLSPVPNALLQSYLVSDIHPTYRDALMKWENQWMALTIDGDMHMGVYRRDLFADAKYRKAFRTHYGRSLEPPETWSDYLQIAKFFHHQTDGQGRNITGTLEAYSKGGQRLWYLFSHAAAYANHADFPGSMFFDPQSMEPTITNPAWRRALSEYLELIKSVPGELTSLDSHEVRSRFSRGEAAMAIDWTDIGVLAVDKKNSVVSDDIGFFMLPGSREVWNPKTKKWDELAKPRRVPFLAFGGWIGAVPKSAIDPDSAWSYLAWYADPKHSINDVVDGTSGINPYRLSHLDNASPWNELMGESLADEYLSVLRQSLASPYVTRDLRIPGYRAYMAALDQQVEQVLKKAISIDEALRNSAAQWEQITDRLGRRSQLRHYRAAMGLPKVAP